jgi:hypothetical protein
MDHDDRVTIGSVVPNLRIGPLPEGWTPVAGIVLVKCIDHEGDPTWAFRTTEGLNDEELLGALVVRTDLLRAEVREAYS